jgi:hypothetical protein
VSLGLLSASACATSRAACAGGIFTDAARAGAREAGPGPRARRQRRVTVDAGRVGPAVDRVTLNLFPDVCVIAHRERTTRPGGGALHWQGRVPGAEPGTVTLVVDDGLMVGTIRLGPEVYEIRYAGEGVHVIIDVDATKFPRD